MFHTYSIKVSWVIFRVNFEQKLIISITKSDQRLRAVPSDPHIWALHAFCIMPIAQYYRMPWAHGIIKVLALIIFCERFICITRWPETLICPHRLIDLFIDWLIDDWLICFYSKCFAIGCSSLLESTHNKP